VDLKSAGNVPETKIVVIDSVKFEGPTTLPDSVRERLVTELKRRPFHTDSDWVAEVTDDPIRGAWQDQGYFKAEVTASVKVVGGDSTHQLVALTVHVEEGPQFLLGHVEFRSTDAEQPLVFAPEDLRKLLLLQEGDIFNADKVRQSFEALRERYDSEGYIDFTAEPTFDSDDANQRVSLIIMLDQEKQYRIGEVEVLGLDAATENILGSKIKSGAVVDYDLVERFFEENRAALPRDASLSDMRVRRNVKTGIVDIMFNFFTCPQVEE
jgi:outer membrane protein assembly factor BamA